ncbi:hypothetical protein UFOVP907_25 [uncultured Caudovirales phage]|uniref:Uncharacterized protein n=1 Tax=uncultured Caudovirales phage TaxID=2100421 RepID=A0A6J5PKF4_9CAUD|nr:hypothetical protein UFOVP907_25 [uncultured Caudovirales phage]
MSDMFIKSGEQPRYFAFNGVNSTAETRASAPIYKESPYGTFQAIVTGADLATVSATVLIQVTNEADTFNGAKSNWITMGTITLAGTTTATDGFTTVCPWRYVRANVTAVAGTGATVETIMGV